MKEPIIRNRNLEKSRRRRRGLTAKMNRKAAMITIPRRKEIIRKGTWNSSKKGWEYDGDFAGIWH